MPETRKVFHEELDQLHADAHHECFIANSVKTEIRVNITG